MRYSGEMFESIAKKSGKISTKDRNRFDNVFNLTKSYDEYLEYLKSEDAKKSRDNALYNRTLQVISEDIDQLTEEEHKDAYEKVTDVLRGSLYRKLVISDKDEAVEISKRNYDALVRFFTAQEIKSLLSIVEVEEVVEIQAIDKNVEVPFSVVEEVPTLKECQDLPTNKERKNCMNDFVNKHIGENFNTSVGDILSPGRKRVFVQFKINTEGYVTDIKARGPHPALEVEAERVISSLPQFIPGKQKGKWVTVPYSIPIVFQVGKDTNPVIDPEEDRIQIIEEARKRPNDYTQSAENIPFSVVEFIPNHPDCMSLTSESEKKNCTSAAVNKHIGNNFNVGLAKTLGLSSGQKRIFIRFIIDKNGDIGKIDARGPHPKLEEEAIRVIELLPRFSPGLNEGKAVNVPYSLPIVFQVAETNKD
jgi:hypothetical protein